MSLRRAKAADEYVDWVRQAVFEVTDFRECLKFEWEDPSRFPAFLDPLQDGINDPHRSVQIGRDSFVSDARIFRTWIW
ncbi:MAG: hypothetical protein WBG92_11655 [Thiohalocapsa sp.]